MDFPHYFRHAVSFSLKHHIFSSGTPERGAGEQAPLLLLFGGVGGAKAPFLKCNRLLSERWDDATESTYAV